MLIGIKPLNQRTDEVTIKNAPDAYQTQLGARSRFPEQPRQVHCHGVQVDVRAAKFYLAETAFAKGATDLIFAATSVPSIAGDSYYVFGTFEVI